MVVRQSRSKPRTNGSREDNDLAEPSIYYNHRQKTWIGASIEPLSLSRAGSSRQCNVGFLSGPSRRHPNPGVLPSRRRGDRPSRRRPSPGVRPSRRHPSRGRRPSRHSGRRAPRSPRPAPPAAAAPAEQRQRSQPGFQVRCPSRQCTPYGCIAAQPRARLACIRIACKALALIFDFQSRPLVMHGAAMDSPWNSRPEFYR